MEQLPDPSPGFAPPICSPPRAPTTLEVEFKPQTATHVHPDLAPPTALLLLCLFNTAAICQTHPGRWPSCPFSLGDPYLPTSTSGDRLDPAQVLLLPEASPQQSRPWLLLQALYQTISSQALLPGPMGSSAHRPLLVGLLTPCRPARGLPLLLCAWPRAGPRG